jgi:hypothetical protein
MLLKNIFPFGFKKDPCRKKRILIVLLRKAARDFKVEFVIKCPIGIEP